jgi:HEAT repeat protein
MAAMRKTEFLSRARDLAGSEIPRKRAWAIRTLAALGRGRELQLVVEALSDPAEVVRESAVEGLELRPPPEHISLLGERLRQDSSPNVRARAAGALGKRAHPSVPAMLIAAAESDPERSVRAESLWQLRFVKPRPSDIGTRAAAILFGNPAPNVRANAARVVEKWCGRQAADVLVPAFEKEGHWLPRAEIVHALARSRSPKASGVVLRALSDADRTVRISALEALEELPRVEAMQPLLALLDDEDEEIRDLAAKALSGLVHWPGGAEELLARAIMLLSAPNERVRETAAAALGGGILEPSLDPRAVGPLCEVLGDSSDRVRLAAVNSLGRLRDDAAVPALCARLAEDEDDFVRRAAADALSDIADPSSVEALRAALHDRSEPVRSMAVLALAEIGGPAVADDLFALREDEEMSVRYDVGFVLDRMGDPRGAPLLEQARAAAAYVVECPNCDGFCPVWE